MKTKEPYIYMRHAYACGCGPGINRVLERYGVDPFDFADNGIAVSRALRLTENPLVKKAADLAIKEWEADRGEGE